MALIITSILLAYILTGLSYIIKDLDPKQFDPPAWTYNPTIKIAIILMMIWPIRQFADGFSSARSIAYGLFGTLCTLSFLTFFVWGCISLSTLMSDTLILQMLISVVLMVIGSVIALPLMSLLMIPVMLILAFPIDLLFPEKK